MNSSQDSNHNNEMTMGHFFTLIAYRPEYKYRDDRSGSVLELLYAESADEIAMKWAKCKMHMSNGREFAETEYTLLIDGKDSDHEYDYVAGSYLPDVADLRNLIDRKVEETLNGLRVEAVEAEQQKRQAEQERRRAEQELAEAAAKVQREARDRAEYARLRAKYEGCHPNNQGGKQ